MRYSYTFFPLLYRTNQKFIKEKGYISWKIGKAHSSWNTNIVHIACQPFDICLILFYHKIYINGFSYSYATLFTPNWKECTHILLCVKNKTVDSSNAIFQPLNHISIECFSEKREPFCSSSFVCKLLTFWHFFDQHSN